MNAEWTADDPAIPVQECPTLVKTWQKYRQIPDTWTTRDGNRALPAVKLLQVSKFV
jgi:hypothetical protein